MAKTRRKWEVNVGDEVWTSIGNRGWTLSKVIKIGRTLVYVGQEGHWRSEVYYLDTGQLRSGYSGSFQTIAYRADQERRSSLVKALRDDHGVEFRFGRDTFWTVKDMESLLDAVTKIRKDKSGDEDREDPQP